MFYPRRLWNIIFLHIWKIIWKVDRLWHDKLKSANITQPSMLLKMESKLALSFSTRVSIFRCEIAHCWKNLEFSSCKFRDFFLKRSPKLKTKNAKVLYMIQITKNIYKGFFFSHSYFWLHNLLMDDQVTLDTSHKWKRNTII
jgi:hypothetical protein